MRQLPGAVLLLLLAWPVAGADDKPKEPATPATEFAALSKEHREAQQELIKSVNAAKDKERQKLFNEGSPRLAKVLDKLVELAEKHPKDPVAVEALVVVLGPRFVGGSDKAARPRAMELVLRDHVTNDKIGRLVPELGRRFDTRTESLLRAILEKNPNKEAKAEAALALAQGAQRKAEGAKRRRGEDAAKLEAEAAAAMKEMADRHLANLTTDRLMSLCQELGFSSDAGSESLMRVLMDKHDKREVQGNACLTLGLILKMRAELASRNDPKAGEALRKEAEDLFTRAAEKYADVKMSYRGTVGSKAKGELYEIRHLAVGKEAPDVEGEDQDGKKFKLSDYRGKVVLLDFWSQF